MKFIKILSLLAALGCVFPAAAQVETDEEETRTIVANPYEQMRFVDTTLVNDTAVSSSEVSAVRLIARSYGDSIVLRWAVEDAGVWLATNRYGWDLLRGTSDPLDTVAFFVDTLTGDTLPFRHMTGGVPIKPLTLAEMQQRFTPEDRYAGVAAQALYGTLLYDVNRDEQEASADFFSLAFHQYQEQTQRQFLAYLAAECDRRVASALGLRFVDTNVRKGEYYEYIVESRIPNGVAEVRGSSVLVLCNPFVRKVDEDMPELLITQIDPYRVALRWERNKLAGYYIERSSDGGKTFRRMNTQAPVWPMNPDAGTRAVYGDSIAQWMLTQVVFVDSLQQDSSYIYRVRAFDAFGDYTDWRSSESYTMTDLIPPTPPSVYPVVVEQNRRCMVYWDAPQQSPDLVGYYVVFSPTSAGPWKVVSPLLKPSDRYFVDSIADLHGRGFYRVFALDSSGNTSYSPAVLNMIEDVFPPAAPSALVGSVDDSVGYVLLQWQPNVDADIYAYKVYYANQKNHDFVERSAGYITDTFFFDSINILTLTPEVYYYVIAVDRSHNFSAPSDTLRIKLPDYIAPGVCLLNDLRQDADSVTLQWLASTSSDVERYVVYRKPRTAPQWQLLRIIPADSIDGMYINFVDHPTPAAVPYSYAIEAIDSALNSSGIAGQAVALVSPSKEYNIDIKLKATSKKNKPVQLSWKMDYKGNKSYYGVVYRSVDGGDFTDIGTFRAGEDTFSDNSAPAGTRCTYYIELHLPRGVISSPSNQVTVKAK